MADNDGMQTRPGVRVHAQVVIRGIHERYGKQIAQIIQENSEISAVLEAVQDERDELVAKLAALTGEGPASPAPVSRAADSGPQQVIAP